MGTIRERAEQATAEIADGSVRAAANVRECLAFVLRVTDQKMHEQIGQVVTLYSGVVGESREAIVDAVLTLLTEGT